MRQTKQRSVYRPSKLSRPWICCLILGMLCLLPSLSRAQASPTLRWGFVPIVQLSTLAYSPDGSLVAIGGDGGVTLYSTSGNPYWSPQTSVLNCTSVAFSPDGKTLAIAGALTGLTGAVELWSMASHELAFSLPTAGAGYFSIAFSPSGSTLAIGSAASNDNWQHSFGVLEEWRVATGARIASLKTSESFVGSIALSPDGKTLAAAGGNSTNEYIELWNVSNSSMLKKLMPQGTLNITSLAFSLIVKRWRAAAALAVASAVDSSSCGQWGRDPSRHRWTRALGRPLFR